MIIANVLRSSRLLADAVTSFTTKAVAGLAADEARITHLLQQTLMVRGRVTWILVVAVVWGFWHVSGLVGQAGLDYCSCLPGVPVPVKCLAFIFG